MKAVRAALLALVLIGASLVPVAPAFADPELDPLTATPTPLITGGTVFGDTLTADPGQWEPAPVDLSYQWLRDGSPILDATALTYTLTTDDVGSTISIDVTGSKIGYASATTTSTPTVEIDTADLTVTPTPLITGGTVFGDLLTADTGEWEPAPVDLSLQWFRGLEPIVGAEASTYQLATDDIGASLSLKVTGSKAGYGSETTQSEPTATITAAALATPPTPTISGSPIFGQTLTADPGTWEPAPVDLAYQWLRDGSPILDATSSTYTLTTDDVGSLITVEVTGSKTGYASASVTSEPTAEIETAELATAPTPTISGSPIFGQTLTADGGTWEPAAVDLAYQWLRGGDPILGETGPTYTLATDDIGTTISVVVTGTKPGYTTLSRTSDPTATITSAPLTTTPTPVLSGNPVFGETLTADPGTWEPAVVDLAYQWFRGADAIVGAEASTYALGLDDIGATISVKVTGSRPGYASVTVSSEPTATITTATLTATPTPVLSGNPVFGETLTADPGTWEPAVVDLSYQWFRGATPVSGATGTTYALTIADLDKAITVTVTGTNPGYAPVTTSTTSVAIARATLAVTPVPTISGDTTFGEDLTANAGAWSPSGVALTYQWFRGGSPIGGATASTYRITDADIGMTIKVAVTGSKTGYTTVTKTSVVTAIVAAAQFSSSTTPAIVGTPKVGNLVGVQMQAWEPAVVSLSYQWRRNGSAIAGATASTYRLTSLDRDKTVSVTVTGSKLGYLTKPLTSPGRLVTSYDLAGPTPTIIGSPQIGSTLSIGPSSPTWTYGATLAYQWKRNGVAISGATASTYTASIADYTKNISVTVTGSLSGYSPVSKSSQATAAVQLGTFTTAAPTITGTARVASTLTAQRGAWEPASATFSYSWKRNGTGILGATGSTYKLTATDLGKTITVTVTAKADGFLNASRTSVATAAIAAGAIAGTTPVITGTTKVGSVLTATKGAWAPSTAAISYQWKRNGAAISGATAATYTLTKSDAGKKITVTVTGSLAGYATTSKTSAATATVTGGVLTSAPPTITGTTRVGSTLTAVAGTWSPAPVNLKYQWKRNGVAISGATAATYKLTSSDSGKLISVTVTGSKTGYTTRSSTSASTATIRP